MRCPFPVLSRLAGAAFLLAAGTLLGGAPSAQGQPRTGDLLVAAADSFLRGQVLVIQPGGGVWTLARFDGAFPSCVAMAGDNRGVLAALAAAPYTVTEIAPGGAITSLLAAGELVLDLDLDDRGRLLAVAGQQEERLLALDLDALTVETLRRAQDVPGAGAPELDSGAWLIARRDPPPCALVRFDPILRAATTVVADLGGIPAAMASDPSSGGVLVALAGPSGCVLGVTPGGAVSTLFAASFVTGVETDPEGMIWLVSHRGASGQASRHDRAGRTIRTIPFVALLGSTGLEIYGRRPLRGSGSARRATTYALELDLPDGAAAGQPFVLAAALGARPPIRFGPAGVLHLRVDDLLVASIEGRLPLFTGFQGRLDARSSAAASVALPPGSAGIRLFFSGVRLDVAHPGGIASVFNPWGVTIR
ncbi:MAG: hypothetical protein JXQ29_12515 [Planctomycetes bacterium]|nr:hypothetical protein [Planctomycetota bacterium]